MVSINHDIETELLLFGVVEIHFLYDSEEVEIKSSDKSYSE